jgi:DNA-binding NtrC family response regulator
MTKKLKILIVDDEDSLRETFGDILSMEGYEITLAKDGYEAIEKVKQQTFDLAFLDIKMPGINGVETFKEIKKINPNIIVFMMTAYSQKELIDEAKKEGAYACFSKPLELEKIEDILHNLEEDINILIVDDDKNISELIAERLKEKGFKTRVVDTGEKTIELINTKKPDVVLLDVVLPDVDGVELFKEITKQLPAQNIIMMSAYDVERKIEDLNVKFFKKPIDFSKLEEEIKFITHSKKKPLILIVDDDEIFINNIKNVLAPKYEVYNVSFGEEAVKVLNLSFYDFAIVNVETLNPEILKSIKSSDLQTKIIFTCSPEQKEEILKAAKSGNFILLKKPFNIKKLFKILGV